MIQPCTHLRPIVKPVSSRVRPAAAPRVIGLDTHEWEFGFWSARLYKRLGILDRFVHTHSMSHTMQRIFRTLEPAGHGVEE